MSKNTMFGGSTIFRVWVIGWEWHQGEMLSTRTNGVGYDMDDCSAFHYTLNWDSSLFIHPMQKVIVALATNEQENLPLENNKEPHFSRNFRYLKLLVIHFHIKITFILWNDTLPVGFTAIQQPVRKKSLCTLNILI